MSATAIPVHLNSNSTKKSEKRKKFKFKVVMRVTAFMSLAALIWGVGMIAIGAYDLLILPVVYLGISAVNMFLCTRSRLNDLGCSIQFIVSILFPCLFQVVAGGALATGVVMMWSMVALLSIATFSSVKNVLRWTAYTATVLFASLVFEYSSFYQFESVIDFNPIDLLIFNSIASYCAIFYIGYFFVSAMEKTRRRLSKAVGEVKELNEELQDKNDNNQQSLIHARDIQNTFFKSEAHLRTVFTNLFLLREARNFVNGDFIWAEQLGDYKYVICGDCGFNGSSQGLLTMLTVSTAERILQETKYTDPGEFLTKLNETLLDNGNLETANLDLNLSLTVLIIHAKTNRTKYASAGGKVFVKPAKGGKVKVYEGQKIGVGSQTEQKHFKGINLDLQIGDMVYLCTDGFANQENESGERYGLEKFTILLQSLDTEYSFTQKRSLKKEFNQWMGKGLQTDDFLICGFEIEDPSLVYEDIEELEIYAGVLS